MMMVTFVHFPRVLVMHLVIEFLGHLQEVRPDQSAVDVGKSSLQNKFEEELRTPARGYSHFFAAILRDATVNYSINS